MILGLSIADGAITVGLWILSSLDGGRPLWYRPLVGLVVRCLAWEREDPGMTPLHCSHTSDVETGTPVATLPGVLMSGVIVRTGRPGVTILWMGDRPSLICSSYQSVAAHTFVFLDPFLKDAVLLLEVKQPRQNQNYLFRQGKRLSLCLEEFWFDTPPPHPPTPPSVHQRKNKIRKELLWIRSLGYQHLSCCSKIQLLRSPKRC